MKPIAVIDIDGTLANCEHRLHHLKDAATDWDAFYADLVNDKPIAPMIGLVQAIADRYTLVYITGRARKWYGATLGWFHAHNVPSGPLYMRKDGDFREDWVIKPELLEEFLLANCSTPDEVAFVIEDRPRCCRMWRIKFGFTTLQLTDREF